MKTVLTITKPYLGTIKPGDEMFGLQMLDKFLHTLEKQPEKPEVICFYTEGVSLCCTSSPILPSLRILEKLGIKLLLCQSCLDYYHLKDHVQLGQIGGMDDIVSVILSAEKVVHV